MIILTTACSHKAIKSTESSEIEDQHKICKKYENWTKQMSANDKEARVYYIYTFKDRIVFLSPYNTLLYSRKGDVIGFQKDGIFHFHAPSKGWKKANTSNVGLIKNTYEGYDDYPDFSTYKAPPSLVVLE